MKINQVIETTTSGSIALVPQGGNQILSRTGVYGKNTKVGSLFKGKKTNKPFVNSISEGKVKELSMDLGTGKDGLSDAEFKNKYGKTKDEMRKAMKQKPEPVKEDELQEDDLILIPGQGLNRKTGFIPHDPDKVEHEGETLKNSLHTIIRTATHLNKTLSTQDNFPEWVSEKVGAIKHMLVGVMDYLISNKEMHGKITSNEMTGGVIAGGIAAESREKEKKINESIDPSVMNRVNQEIKSVRFIAPAVEDIMVNIKEQARIANIDNSKFDELESKVHAALRQLESSVIELGDPFKELGEGQIYSTGGGAGQAYRKFVPKESSVMKGLMNYESR